jgi:hypothetical protein
MMKHLPLATLVALTVIPSTHAASNGVLVDDLRGASGTAALAAAEKALVSRGWAIQNTGADGVSATLLRPDVRSKLRVSVSGNELVYEEVSRLTHRGVGSRPTKQPVALYSEAPLPGSLLALLRSGVEAQLSPR